MPSGGAAITVLRLDERLSSFADRFVYGISNISVKQIAAKYVMTLMPVVITI